MPAIRPPKNREGPKDIPKPHGIRYPWEDWFGRLPITLYRGRDYHCRTDGMAVNIYVASQREGQKVSVETDPYGRWVKIYRRKDA